MRKLVLIGIFSFLIHTAFPQKFIAFSQKDNPSGLKLEFDDLGKGEISIEGLKSTITIENGTVVVKAGKRNESVLLLNDSLIIPTEKFPDSISDIFFTNITAQYLMMSGNLERFPDTYFRNCSIKSLMFFQGGGEIYFWNTSVDSLYFVQCDTLDFTPDIYLRRVGDSKANYLAISQSSVSQLHGVFSSINLRSVSFLDPPFNINYLKKDSTRINIGLNQMDMSQLIFDSQFFKFDNSLSRVPHEGAVTIFNQIKDTQKKYHFEKGYELVDKDLIEFQNLNNTNGIKIVGVVKNWISKWWWDYGYDKGKVVTNSLYLMLGFFIINLFFFKGLLTTYPIKSLVEAEKVNRTFYVRHEIIRHIKSFFYCFFYTGTLFWGIKFDFEKVSLEKIGLVILVIIEYTTGIVCLAYIANYIIVR